MSLDLLRSSLLLVVILISLNQQAKEDALSVLLFPNTVVDVVFIAFVHRMSRKSYWVAPHFQTQKPSTGVDAVQVMCKKNIPTCFSGKIVRTEFCHLSEKLWCFRISIAISFSNELKWFDKIRSTGNLIICQYLGF